MSVRSLPEIVVPDEFNYIAVFLTFACQLRCSYCINHHGGDLVKGRWMSGDDWLLALNRITTRPDLPLTLQGGEPTVHKHFYEIVNGIRKDSPIDLLTNLEVDARTFMSNIHPDRMKRDAPYASIRVSYHKEQMKLMPLLHKVRAMLDLGYSVGIWAVDHPRDHEEIVYAKQTAMEMGIDFRLKEFLGPYQGEVHGTFRYPHAVDDKDLRRCDCRTSEFLIGPDGAVFRCHSDLYANRASIGHILDPDFSHGDLGKWRTCGVMGMCNSCDVKVKNNRFQEWGHSSVEIRNVSEPYAKNANFVPDVINTYGKPDRVSVDGVHS